MDTFFTIAAGAGLLAASAAAWSGIWKAWARRFITAHLPIPVTLLPAFGLLLIALGIDELNLFGWARALSASAMLLVLAAVVLMLWNPLWWGPLWYRQLKAQFENIEADLRDPLTAASHAAVSSSSLETPREPFTSDPPLVTWRASLVAGEKPDEPTSPWRQRKVGGKLCLHPEAGLVFVPRPIEVRARSYPILRLRNTEIIGVAVGRGGKCSQGQRQVALFFPPRLCIRTHSETYVFEVFLPGRIANAIAEHLHVPE